MSGEDGLSRLPTDVLVDAVLAAIHPRSLCALSSTCHRWRRFLSAEGSPCEILWQRRAAKDFKFPVHATGRRTGWYRLYGRLASGGAWVWGAAQNGRLGLPVHNSVAIPRSIRKRLIGGGIPIPTQIRLPDPPAVIVAGGWSFHALTTTGEVISWGEMQPSNGMMPVRELSAPVCTLAPQRLPQMQAIGPIQQIAAGRDHVVMLGDDGQVWEFRSVGRVAALSDADGRWGDFGEIEDEKNHAIASVYAGWSYSAALTFSGDAYIWWKPDMGKLHRAALAAGEAAEGFDNTRDGVAVSLQVTSLKLPDLPLVEARAETIAKLACGDEFVIALTSSGRVYQLDVSLPQMRDDEIRSASVQQVEHDFVTQRRQWTYLRAFSELETTAAEGDRGATRISHITAHFNTFAAYSVPSSGDTAGSVVLLGQKGSMLPKVIPELQNIGVIELAHGDYHNLALTSSGRVLSWGAFSAGALGLGHPEMPNTPLSPAPPAEDTDAAEPEAQAAAAPPPPPGMLQRAQAFLPPMPAMPPQLVGLLLPGGLIGGPGPVVARPTRRLNAPDRVDTPMQVEIDTQLAPRMRRNTKDRYVYSITAAGWHSACLAVELDNSSSPPPSSSAPVQADIAAAVAGEEEEEEEEEEEQEPVIDFHLARTAADTMTRSYTAWRADRDERRRAYATDATDGLNGMATRFQQMRFGLAPAGAPPNPFGPNAGNPSAPDAQQ